MAKTRLPYPPEFRRQMVELVHAGRSPEELAQEFEPTAQSIRNWVAQSARNAGRGDGGLTRAEREELSRLRRENRPRLSSNSTCRAISSYWPDGFTSRKYGIPGTVELEVIDPERESHSFLEYK